MGSISSGIKRVMINKMDLPREIIRNSHKLIIEGNEFLTIENHRGIVKFLSEEIILKVDTGLFFINGSRFDIVYISGRTLKIKGILKGVRYEEL